MATVKDIHSSLLASVCIIAPAPDDANDHEQANQQHTAIPFPPAVLYLIALHTVFGHNFYVSLRMDGRHLLTGQSSYLATTNAGTSYALVPDHTIAAVQTVIMKKVVYIIVLSILSLDMMPMSQAARGDDVAVCLVVKDQNDDILEFLDYHRMIGVGHFYIYDNNSTEPVGPIIREYHVSGFVDYVRFKVREGIPKRWHHSPQYLAYKDCLHAARKHHKWLVFIDADEFLLIKDKDTNKQKIGDFLKDYESFGGLGVNWVMFGSSGWDTKPPNSTLTSYTKCVPQVITGHNHIKSIINTKYVDDVGGSPHDFVYKPGFTTVNEKKISFEGSFSPFSGDKIILLHYFLKSKAEFLRKVKRGSGDGWGKTIDFFDLVNQQATDTCQDALEIGRKFESCCFAGAGAQRPKQQNNDPLVRLEAWLNQK